MAGSAPFVVSIPTWRTPPKLLERSVRSALASDAEPLVVLVEDGRDLHADYDPPTHDRLIRHRLAENRGRYFADAVVVGALAPEQWWAPLDSDDWVEPGHWREVLMTAASTGAAVSSYERADERNRRRYVQNPSRARLAGQPTEAFHHLAHWCSGVYRADRVERAGGIHPGFRVGFDTLFVLMLYLTGPIETTAEGGYHWERRNGGSLTTSRETRFGSPHRIAAKERLVALYRQAWAERDGDPGAVVRRDVEPALRDDVARESEALAGRLERWT